MKPETKTRLGYVVLILMGVLIIAGLVYMFLFLPTWNNPVHINFLPPH